MQYIVQLHILACIITQLKNEKFSSSEEKKEFASMLLAFEGKTYWEFFEFLWKEDISYRYTCLVFAIAEKVIDLLLWKYFRFLSDEQAKERFKELFYNSECLDCMIYALDMGLKMGASKEALIRNILLALYFPDPCLQGLKGFDPFYKGINKDDFLAYRCTYFAIEGFQDN